MLQQILHQHVIFEVLIACPILRILFPHLDARFKRKGRTPRHILGIAFFLPDRHGEISPITKLLSDQKMGGFVSNYSIQTSLVICYGPLENEVLCNISFIDKNIIVGKNEEAFAKRVADKIQVNGRIQPMAVGEKNLWSNFPVVDF